MSPAHAGQGRLMALCGRAEPRRPGSEGQVTLFRNGPVNAALAALALATAGCSSVERMSDSKLTLETPIGWWHDLQGGKIAEVRPPPPGVDDPYPNLAQVPPPPTPTDPATRRALAARLVAERDRTRREATQDPLILPTPINSVPGNPAPVRPAAPASAAARPPAPPPDPGASVAVLEAATAQPAEVTQSVPPAPAAPAPAAAPQASTPPAPVPSATGARGALEAGGPALGRPLVESGPVPDLPDEAPPLPRLSGIPASVNALPVPRLPRDVTVAFPRGSAALPATADAALRELAGRRAGAAIAVAAGGDAAGSDAAVQARALPLALRRARSMQDALTAAGVPADALRVEAAALGRGGEAHLLR